MHLKTSQINLKSFGNYPQIENNSFSFKNIKNLKYIIKNIDELIPYGNGRSYGDSALNSNIVTSKHYNSFLGFDSKNNILHCEAGILLSEILEVFVPRGFFLEITPGTKYITVGGAIASDVHGKNHHVAGTFSNSITELTLMLPDQTK